MTESPADLSDEMLMLRYQRGDRSAFAQLVGRHKIRVYNFTLRRLRNAAAAEDVAQEAFLRVVQRASEFKHEARFSTWLYTIVRNLCVDHLRRMKHRSHRSLDEPGETGTPLVERVGATTAGSDAERRAASGQMGQRITAAVEALPDDQREVFLLREVAGLPFRDIAELTGTSENTVKSRMRYALERLKAALAEFEEFTRALR